MTRPDAAALTSGDIAPLLAEVPPPDEEDVIAIAHQVSALGARSRAGIYHLSWWSDRVLHWAMSHEDFKTQLFRLVDTLPSLGGDDAAIADYLDQYFSGVDIPRLVEIGLSLSEKIPGGMRLSSSVTVRNVERMARQFIAGRDENEAARRAGELWRHGLATTVDLLGEHTFSDREADAYAQRALRLLNALVIASDTWPHDDLLERDRTTLAPRVSLSIKVSALTAAFGPLTIDRAVDEAEARMGPLLDVAAGGKASIFLDMESYETKDVVHSLLTRLTSDRRWDRVHLGVVVQAYLGDALTDLLRVIELSGARVVPLSVRLVKGAYWDTETITAAACGWPDVVFADKAHTDANYERCIRVLLAHLDTVHCAFASHNLRSLAYAMASARRSGIPDSHYEIQLLYGMAEPVQAALRSLGTRLRIYSPVGALVPGMSYLVRRLLENTSNESFVRHRFAEGKKLDDLLHPPEVGEIPALPPVSRILRPATDAHAPPPYRPEPPLQWRSRAVREAMAAAIERGAEQPVRDIPVLIDGRRVDTGKFLDSVNPTHPDRVVARSSMAGVTDASRAVEIAQASLPIWRRANAADRAGILFRAAHWLRARRYEIAALEVFEVGKPWAEADADVCEAIDFCEYYGREALRLEMGGRVDSPPGESNRLIYDPRGVVAVIAPWNFPLAIPAGMTTGALAAGNTVILKPAEQSPACAYILVEALLAAGLPPGVLGFLPGSGEKVGHTLVEHPGIDVIAFTGSREVGLSINENAARRQAGRRSVCKVVSEMGGKNAIVVDADADLDEAVAAVIRSAFGFSGQKCSAASRVIAVGPVYDRLAQRLVGAASALAIGDPREMGTQMGPLIESSAVERIARYRRDPGGEILLERDDVPATGYFAGPVIVGAVDPDSPLATDEIFGPVLALFSAGSFEEALALANRTDYALTAGVVTRSPRHILQAATGLRAGNVYVNRSITGAVVGRQPFGGAGLSGVGSKAGGPDYVAQFTIPRVVSENTMRHGFAPTGGAEGTMP